MKEKDARLDLATNRELLIELASRGEKDSDPEGRYLEEAANDILTNLSSRSLNYKATDESTNTQ